LRCIGLLHFFITDQFLLLVGCAALFQLACLEVVGSNEGYHPLFYLLLFEKCLESNAEIKFFIWLFFLLGVNQSKTTTPACSD
jgi:hypothetical protein